MDDSVTAVDLTTDVTAMQEDAAMTSRQRFDLDGSVSDPCNSEDESIDV